MICLLGFALSVHGQIRSGTITGTVTDQNGAVVRDAEVTVTNAVTHESVSTRSTATGSYTVPYLESGSCNVSVSRAGFSTQTARERLLQFTRPELSLERRAVFLPWGNEPRQGSCELSYH
jgi:hypothetical protein